MSILKSKSLKTTQIINNLKQIIGLKIEFSVNESNEILNLMACIHYIKLHTFEEYNSLYDNTIISKKFCEWAKEKGYGEHKGYKNIIGFTPMKITPREKDTLCEISLFNSEPNILQKMNNDILNYLLKINS